MMVWKLYTCSRNHTSKFELWPFPQASDMWFNTLSWFWARAMTHSSQSAMRLYTYNNYAPTQSSFVSLPIQRSANYKIFSTLLWLPRRCSGEESANQYRGHKRRRFNPWVWKIPRSKKWQSTPVFCLENSMDRGAWWTTVYGIAKNWTQMSTHTHFIIK